MASLHATAKCAPESGRTSCYIWGGILTMNDFVPFPPPPPVEGLYLVGFRLDPTVEGPQFYTLFVLEGDNERPSTENGRILFFIDPADGAKALERSDKAMRAMGEAPTQLEM